MALGEQWNVHGSWRGDTVPCGGRIIHRHQSDIGSATLSTAHRTVCRTRPRRDKCWHAGQLVKDTALLYHGNDPRQWIGTTVVVAKLNTANVLVSQSFTFQWLLLKSGQHHRRILVVPSKLVLRMGLLLEQPWRLLLQGSMLLWHKSESNLHRLQYLNYCLIHHRANSNHVLESINMDKYK